MNDFEIDTELKNLLRNEERKLPSTHVSIEAERFDLLLLFQDHVTATNALPEVVTVESFFDNDLPTDDFYEDSVKESRLDVLTERVTQDVESQQVLAAGEMRASGEGYYHFYSDERGGDEYESLSDGDALSGYIAHYTVLPMAKPSYIDRLQTDTYDPETDKPTKYDYTDGIWVILSDVIVYDGSGFEQARHEFVSVPFSYPGLKFHKIERQTTENVAPETRPREDVGTQLLSTELSERCIQVENDMNYNPVESYEQNAKLIGHQEYINQHTAHINRNAVITLSYFDATDPSGQLKYIEGQTVRYAQSIICEEKGKWRVLHCFESADESKGLTFVASEHIDSIIELP